MRSARSILPLCLLALSLSATAQSPSGTYRFVKDSDGKSAKSGADITLTFSNGTFRFKALQPGETITDAGTWKVTGNSMTISFNEMEQGKKTGAWSLSNGSLTLPFMMLTNGSGSSTWQDVNVAIVPQGTVMEVITRNMEGVKKITQHTDKVDEWSKADEKKYKGGLAESYYVKANLFYFKRFKPEALYAFAKAAQLKPTNALYLNNLAEVIMDYNKYSDAVILLKEVTKNFPNLDNPFGNLAVAQYNLGNLKAADSAIRVARRLNPTNGLYCYTDGKIKEKKGDKTGAQKDFEDAWKLGYAGSGREGAKNASQSDANKNGINATPVKPNPKANRNDQNKSKAEQDREKIAQWEGHYEASVVSARSGETPEEERTVFGKDLAQTTIGLKTLACAKEFNMDISKSGIINGSGKILYVYQGTANGPVAGMTPGPLAAQANNFGANLKDGFQIRDWSFTGEVDADGNVTINGMPTEQLDLLNVGKWQKIKPWSAFPPDAAGAAMKGPFHMKIVNDEKKGPVIYVNQYLELGDALIKKVHYRAYIFRSTADVAPDCMTLGAEPTPKCPASEFIKTKVAFSPHENISVEQSTTYTKDANGIDKPGIDEMAVNVVCDREIGVLKQGMELHADGSFEMTVGIGVGTESFFEHSPIKVGERLDLVYDSKCGWGVKASASAEAGGFGTKTGASVEGVIFFNKAM